MKWNGLSGIAYKRIRLILFVYISARLGQSFLPIRESDVFADTTQRNTNLVAVLVDKNLYNNSSVQTSIQRYTQSYIQKELSDTKAIVFPLDTDTIHARDISKLLENLYYDGIPEQASTLLGVIIIGDQVPLPVINEGGKIFPSIFPYTDFDNPQYYRDPQSTYFVPDKTKQGQAEIRHSTIALGTNPQPYTHFFEKLKAYATDPQSYVGNRIWYDDLIDQSNSFNDLALPSYLNNFLFAEDIAYHRYHPLMVELLKKLNEDEMVELLHTNTTGTIDEGLQTLLDESEGSAENIPTAFVKDTLQGFMKSYTDLYGITAQSRTRDNILSAGRRSPTQIDNHSNKILSYDQLYNPGPQESQASLLVEINSVLEDKLIQKIKNNKYALHIAIPVRGKITKHIYNKLREGQVPSQFSRNSLSDFFTNHQYYSDGIYEAFYYGRNAVNITGIDQTSIFLGTPNEIHRNLDQLAILPHINTDTSIGSSFDIFSEFVEANRGYNTDLVSHDQIHMNNDCGSDPMNYINSYRGGNTPLNLTGSEDGKMSLQSNRYDRAGVSSRLLTNYPSSGQVPSIYDIGGSQAVTSGEDRMIPENLLGGFLQKVVGQHVDLRLSSPSISNIPINSCDSSSRAQEPLTSHNILAISGVNATGYYKHFTIEQGNTTHTLLEAGIPCPATPETGSVCRPHTDKPKIPDGMYVQKQELTYKTIDSTIVHSSPTPEQINQFTMTTPSRPIDSERYITFRGIGGNQVSLPFPNLYDISVYKASDITGQVVLKTAPEIRQSIIEYLQTLVDDYNSKLVSELTLSTAYFNTQTDIFTKLGAVNPAATPARVYSLLPRTLFVDSVDPQVIDSIAQILLTINSILPDKTKTSTISQEIQQVLSSSSISQKKKLIIDNYLRDHSDETFNPFSFPGYQTGGYELVALTSNGEDEVITKEIPSQIQEVQDRLSEAREYQNYLNQLTDTITATVPTLQDQCGLEYGEPVPLFSFQGGLSFPWFDALGCRLETIKIPKVTIDFPYAQGDVLIPDFLRDLIDPDSTVSEYTIPDYYKNQFTIQNENQINLLKQMNIKLTSSVFLLNPSTPVDLQPQITLEYQGDNLGDVHIKVASTGDDCVIIENTNTCSSLYHTTIAHKDAKVFTLQPLHHNAGSISLQVYVCRGNVCGQKPLLLSQVATTPTQIGMTYEDTPFLASTPVPFRIRAKDFYNNPINKLIEPLLVNISGGTINNLSTVTLNDINTTLFVTALSGQQSVDVSVSNRHNTLRQDYQFSFLPGELVINHNPSTTGSWDATQQTLSYQLPHDPSIRYTTGNNGVSLTTQAVPQFTLHLQHNTTALVGPVEVESLHNLVTPGTFTSDKKGNNKFVAASHIIIDRTGSGSLLLFPTGKSGTDKIIFTLPDGSKKEIILTIRPGPAHHIEITQTGADNTMNTNSTTNLTISLYDYRNNSVEQPELIKLFAFGPLRINGMIELPLLITQTHQSVSLTSTQRGGSAYILAHSSNHTILPAIWSTTVQASIVPRDSINTLYLSLIGQDRGNRYNESKTNTFSLIPKLINQSNKLLSVTTQLVDPRDIGTIVQLIDDPHHIGELMENQRLVQLWQGGSTNSEKKRAIIDISDTLQRSHPGDISTASSPSQLLGWRNNQHYLTQFGQGKRVGEATVTQASDLLINYGDPLIKRINHNLELTGTQFDNGPGQQLISTSNKTILKTFSANINGDQLKDIVTVYVDGSVERNKQYGGTQEFIAMGPLVQLFGDIKEVYSSDTRGDGFSDIIVELSDGTLRAYTNTEGVFSVDGYPVCLTGTEDDNPPDNINGFDQWMIEDMDRDGADDIITNHNDTITIIYGKRTSAGHSYISNTSAGCDAQWNSRQQSSLKILSTLGVQFATGIEIVDDSLLRRKGIGIQNEDSYMLSDGEDDDSNNSPNPYLDGVNLEGFFNTITADNPLPNLSDFPINSIVDNASQTIDRWSMSPIDYTPLYETSLSGSDIQYITSKQSELADHVRTYKIYKDINGGILKKDDVVEVSVTIKGIQNNPLTYIDYIAGPRKIQFNNNTITGRDIGSLNTSHVYHNFEPRDGYSFAIDNILLGSANQVQFSYHLIFQGGSTTKIKVHDRNADDYPDISLYPLGGCNQFFWTYKNTASLIQSYREYHKDFIDLVEKVSDYAEAASSTNQNFIGDITNSIEGLLSTDNDVKAESQSAISEMISSITDENFNIGQFVGDLGSSLLQPGGLSLSLEGLGSRSATLEQQLVEKMQSLCQGGSASDGSSCGGGLPIPFNMAFLSPGTFNIMGCKPNIKNIDNIFPKDGGFPIFAFPANLGPIPPVGYLPLPFPRGGFQKGASDSYGYFGFPSTMGPYSSFIRVYLSPTLTQQMGVALCFGPQKVGKNRPKPFNHFMGNCIVAKLPNKKRSCDVLDTDGKAILSDSDLFDLDALGSCLKTPIRPSSTSTITTSVSNSPFQLIQHDTTNGSISSAFPAGNYFGIIDFEQSAIIETEPNNLTNDTEDEGDILRGGRKVSPKLQGGKPSAKGLVACVVNDRLDRQVNYMINNLTNMQIGIYLPDFSQLGQGWDTLDKQLASAQAMTGAIDHFKTFGQQFGSQGDGITSQEDTFSGSFIEGLRNATINQSSLQHLSNGFNNPFDQVEELFKQIPLIRINQKDVTVKVPMIYAEDITKYESYLKAYLERNKKIIEDRTDLLQSALGVCGKRYSLTTKEGEVALYDEDSQEIQPLSSLEFLTPEYFQRLRKKLAKEKEFIEKYITLFGTQCLPTSHTRTTQDPGQDHLFFEKINTKTIKTSQYSPQCIQALQELQLSPDEITTLQKEITNHFNRNNLCGSLFFGIGLSINVDISSLLTMLGYIEKLQTNIKANIRILDSYRRFPLQLYQWTHVVDRYLTETVSAVDNFLSSISLWLKTNATRFEQYVDAIITMSLALETRQAIIDLSINRQEKCSTCTVDNYNMYACGLGFVCKSGLLPKLPLLRLPPFKIPNITLDMSHFDVGMEILLPQFQFVPTSVVLPQLPDLPQAPTVDFDIVLNILKELSVAIKLGNITNLPNLPLLPEPPTLPELPSFVPTIHIDLPLLPPAPKIPNIAPELQSIIATVKFVSKLYCIVKGGIGLVAENGVKTRIEQLTQRTYEIPQFDNLNLNSVMSYPDDKLEGFDYQIDAFVNFTYNFEYVYDLIQMFANRANGQTDKLMERSQQPLHSDKLNEFMNNLDAETQQNIAPLGYSTSNDTTNETSPSQQKNQLNEVLSFLIADSDTPTHLVQQFQGLQHQLNIPSSFVAQDSQLHHAQDEINEILHEQRSSLKAIAAQFSDQHSYKQFLQQIQQPISNYKEIDNSKNYHEITASLFSGNTDILASYNTSITNKYLQTQHRLLDEYRKGVAQVTDVQEQAQVSKILREISYLQSSIDTIINPTDTQQEVKKISLFSQQSSTNSQIQTMKYKIAKLTCNDTNDSDIITTNSYPSSTLHAQIGGATQSTLGTADESLKYRLDFTQKGISKEYSTATGPITQIIVTPSYFTEQNKGLEAVDLNDDDHEDVILWSDKNVRIKYAQQYDIHPTSNNVLYHRFYVAPVWQTAQQREQAKRITINDTTLSVWNSHLSVKNLRVQAQDYDSFAFSWSNSVRQHEDINGYLLELSPLPDLYHLKAYDDVPDRYSSQYVLLLPNTNSGDNGRLMIPDQLPIDTISNYSGNKLINVAHYNPTSETLYYSITDIPRRRYYSRITSLQNQGSDRNPLYIPAGPRSHHVVAGQQIIADTAGPNVEVVLRRVKTSETIDTGLSPRGLVNTLYTAVIIRHDPNGVQENRITNGSGEIISSQSGSLALLPNLYFQQGQKLHYRLGAKDFKNNTSNESLEITIDVPTISIDTILEDTSNQSKTIASMITEGMDDGIVQYQKKHNGNRSLLPVVVPSLFQYPLQLNQTFISGGIYNHSPLINFSLANDELVATLNKTNGELHILSGYQHRILPQVDLTNNRPVIVLKDTQTSQNLFSLQLKQRNAQLSALGNNTQVISLQGSAYGSFDGGQCLARAGSCIVSLSNIGDMTIITHPYQNTLQAIYLYNTLTKQTSFIFSDPSDGTLGSVSFEGYIP